MRSTARTKEESRTPRITVLHNPGNSAHTMPHPNIRKGMPGRGITVLPHERVVMDWDTEDVDIWRNSYVLKNSIDAGYIKIEEYDCMEEVPKKLALPSHLQLTDPMDRQTVNNIVYHDDDILASELIAMTPYFRDTAQVDIQYLKTKHSPVLRLARWYFEQGEGHTYRLQPIVDRIARIAEM